MTKKRKYKSDIATAIHETAAGLHEIGLIDEKTMREFDASCLTSYGKLQKHCKAEPAPKPRSK